jgi:hypothetical protein
MTSADGTRSPLEPVLLGTEVAIMVGLVFYAMLVMEPPIEYIAGVLAAAGATGWAALECLFWDWPYRGGHGARRRRPPPSPVGRPGGPSHGRGGQDGPAHRPVLHPVPAPDAEATDPSVPESVPSFFRRPPSRA